MVFLAWVSGDLAYRAEQRDAPDLARKEAFRGWWLTERAGRVSGAFGRRNQLHGAMMQKLITICLHGSEARHRAVEEHLQDLLADGWRILSVNSAASPAGAAPAVVWFAVVLEKGQPAGQPFDASRPGQAALSPFVPVFEAPQSAEGHPVEPSDIPVGPETPLEVGSTVLAYSQGRWWRAEVIGLEGEDQVTIHFPGWDAKWDVTVPREELQVDLNASEE